MTPMTESRLSCGCSARSQHRQSASTEPGLSLSCCDAGLRPGACRSPVSRSMSSSGRCDLMTISVFRERDQAAGSVELAALDRGAS